MHTLVHQLRRRFTPTRWATLITALYVLVAMAYVLLGGSLALTPTQELAAIVAAGVEQGMAVMGGTAVLLFVGVRVALKRVSREMEGVLAQQEAMMLAERRAVVGTLALSSVHDVNNLLQIACGHLELLGLRLRDADEDTRRLLANARDAMGGLVRHNHDLREAGRGTATQLRQTHDLGLLLDGSLMLVRQHGKLRSRTVRMECDGVLVASVVPALLRDAVINLVLNAADATAEQGEILVRVQRAGQRLVVEVHDDGPGVPPEQRERIFDPYVTTKADGTGLGLLSVRMCAEVHDGRASVGPSALGGACFRLDLPCTPPEPPPGTAPVPSKTPQPAQA